MANIDWDAAQDKFGNKYKDYAPVGVYKVKCVDVEFKTTSTGSIAQKFQFEEDDKYQYPTADHWLSFNNDQFRVWHEKNLLVLLGATESTARTAVEKAEEKEEKSAIAKMYEAAFKQLLKKNPEVEIEVYDSYNENNGKTYARAEFTDRSVAMPHDNAPKKEVSEPKEEAKEDEIDLSDIPF